MDLLKRLRRICLALPEAEEQITWGHPTFRVRGRIFATYGDGDAEHPARATFKAPPGVQAMLMEAAPERFFVPPYVGSKGWVGVKLDAVCDWAEIESLARRSWSLITPKTLAKQHPSP
jgi:hypothetical protein